MVRTPKFGRTFQRRRIWFFRPRRRFKLPEKITPAPVSTAPAADRPSIGSFSLSVVLSVLIHVLLLFGFVLTIRLLIKPPAAPPLPLIVPQSFLSGNQFAQFGKPPAPLTPSLTIKHFLNSHNATSSTSQNLINAMLNGSSSNTSLYAISLGQGGQLASSTGSMGVMGMPGNTMGGMPAVSFFGIHGQARRIVFILDHSGSMVGNLYLVRAEVKHTIENLLPFQKFAVIAFAHSYKILGPHKLLRASPAAKASVLAALKTIEASGHNDNMLGPFLRPFQAAWAMHPQAIFFLTDGHFDSRLIARIHDLNSQHPIRVYTFAFLDDDRIFQGHLRRIAEETGGKFANLTASILQRSHNMDTP